MVGVLLKAGTLHERAVTTIVGGEIVYDQGKVNTEIRGQALTFL